MKIAAGKYQFIMNNSASAAPPTLRIDGSPVYRWTSEESSVKHDRYTYEIDIHANRIEISEVVFAIRGADGLNLTGSWKQSWTGKSWPARLKLVERLPGETVEVSGTNKADVVIGVGPDKNRFEGRGGADRLVGMGGEDLLLGGAGNDRLLGGTGADYMVGGAGADLLWGQKGADKLAGGAGADDFAFRAGHGRDLIMDWQEGLDDIVFHSGARRFRDLEFTQRGDDVRIDYGKASDSIIVRKAEVEDFDPGDFVFA